MTDESPPRRLSQIFDPLTSLSDLEQIKQQIQQHQAHLQQQQQQQNSHKYGVGVGGPSNSSSSSTLLQFQQQHQQQNQGGAGGGGYNYNTASSSTSISSASNQSAKLSSSSSTSSYIGGPPPGLSRIVMGSRSTPNSPRLMARRGTGGSGGPGSNRPPIVPPRSAAAALPPNAVMIANPSLAALDSDAPWPAFSSLTDNLDVHQVNNYNQGLPEINWQERCLELQLELHRSRNQAGRVRDMLREKLSELEQRVIEAEERAEEAEDKVR